MVRVLLSRHQSPTFEGPDGMGDIPRVQHGRLAQFGLAQLPPAGQRRQAPIPVAVDPRLCQVLVQRLVRSCRGRTQNPGRE